MVYRISEYASSLWDPHTNFNLNLFKDVQLGNQSQYSSVTNTLLFLGLPSLQSRRKLAKLITKFMATYTFFKFSDSNHHDSRDGYFIQLQCQILINFYFSLCY